MSGLIPLGNIISLEYGKSLPESSRLEGLIPVYGSNGQTGWHNEPLIEGPSLIVGRKGSIGRVHYHNGPSFPIDTTYYVKPRPGVEIDLKFAYYMIREAGLTELNSATGVPGLSRDQAYKVRARLPLLEEQQRIVQLLDRAAEIRRRADAARAKARAIIPALFLDMFGDPASEWPVVTIADILADQDNAIRTGPFGSQLKHSEFTEDGVPVLGIDNVVDNEFKWAKPRHLPQEKYKLFTRFRVFPGDVIVTIMGTTGRVCVAPDSLPECMSTKHLCAFTLNRAAAHPRFIWAALLFDPSVRAQVRSKANGQIMEGWNMSIVRTMRVLLPPVQLQSCFAEQAKRIEATARALDVAAIKAEAMAAALSAEVFGDRREQDKLTDNAA